MYIFVTRTTLQKLYRLDHRNKAQTNHPTAMVNAIRLFSCSVVLTGVGSLISGLTSIIGGFTRTASVLVVACGNLTFEDP